MCKNKLFLKYLTYRQKNQYLAIGAVLFAVIIFILAISKTLALYHENKKIETSLTNADAFPQQVEHLQKRLSHLNNSFSVYLSDSLHNQDKILEYVSRFSQKNNLTLTELPLTTVAIEDDFIVETNKTIAEGQFINLLKLLYELEYRSRIARISSASFNSYFDNKRKKTILTMTIYLQNIKIKKKGI